MKLEALNIKNFRSYQDTTTIYFDNLTALIGKNDVGKSLEEIKGWFESLNDVLEA